MSAAQQDLFRLFTQFIDEGEQLNFDRKLSSSSHGAPKKKNDEAQPHGHDGEHKTGETIQDGFSDIAEVAIFVISLTYVMFFLLTMLGYCIRSYQKNKFSG